MGSRVVRAPRGRRFTSFDDAWEDVLGRRAPLESFLDSLPDDDTSTVDVWLALPDERARRAAVAAQRAFAHLDWVAPAPAHFLHVAVVTSGEECDAEAWRGVSAFELELGPLTCFHEAVVAEAHGGGTRRLRELAGLPVETHLPHLSLGYFRRAADAAALREALVPLRERLLGRMPVREVALCRVPVGRRTLFAPWRVLEAVRLETPR